MVLQEIPKVHLKCKRNAQSGSWFARDNSASFLKWGKSFGMQDDCLFESEDLGKVILNTSFHTYSYTKNSF